MIYTPIAALWWRVYNNISIGTAQRLDTEGQAHENDAKEPRFCSFLPQRHEDTKKSKVMRGISPFFPILSSELCMLKAFFAYLWLLLSDTSYL